MKVYGKGAMMVAFGILLAAVTGCKEEKTIPADAEEVKQTAEAMEKSAVKQAPSDVPKDHPAH